MKLTARQQRAIKARKAVFVVGYLRAGNCIYSNTGAFTQSGDDAISRGGIELMTRREARTLLANMPCAGAAIFRLVPVEKNR